MYVCLCGLPGVGKSTFAKILAEMTEAELVLESPEEFPLVDAAFKAPDRFAYANQLDFILAKARDQLRFLRSSGNVVQELDVLATHRIWTPTYLTLGDITETQAHTADQVVSALMRSPLRQPDLYVLLAADVPAILRRIASRGREFEVESNEMSRLLPLMIGRIKELEAELRDRCIVLDVSGTDQAEYPEMARRALNDARQHLGIRDRS